MDLPSYEFNLEKLQCRYEYDESLLERQQKLLDELQASSKQSHKRTHRERDHEFAHQRLVNDYFVESLTYIDNQFHRRYRIQIPLFLRIVNSLSNDGTYFTQRRNNAGERGLLSLQKCIVVIRMLAYGVAADACDEYVKIGETITLECLRKFCHGIISIFEKDYLRRPNAKDFQRLLHVGPERAFPK